MALVRTLLGLAFFVSASALGQGFPVEIYNNTATDLCVDGKSQRDCKEIPPKQLGRVSIRASQWIQFGMEAYRYRFPKDSLKPGLKLQAEPDGKLYLVPAEATLPTSVLPKQPGGFPLVPRRKADLT
jgi:hypothetical protein